MTLPLPVGWLEVTATRAANLVRELHLELAPGHLLYQCAVRTVAACGSNDDVLFQHTADLERYTVVHLTYRGKPELDTHYPTIVADGSWAEFLRQQQHISNLLED